MSKQVDERIVSMQFDNADFEKKVSQTQQSIKDLNNTINSADASKINDSLSHIGDTLDTIKNRFSATGVAIATVISNITSSVMGLASKVSGFAIDSIITGGKNRALNLQKAQFSMEGLLKSSEKVERVMKDVNYGVQDTAYSLDAAANVAASLVASGVTFAETMDEIDGTSLMARSLRAISGVAAQTGSDYSEIGHIFTTIAGQGKMMTMQLRQLEMRGFNAAATMGEVLGATEEEVREMVNKGKIDFETFSDAMDQAFGEHAKDANKTFTGVMSNIKSAFAKIGAVFAEPLFENQGSLVQFLDSIRALINDFKSTLAPLTNVVRWTLDSVLTPLTTKFEEIHKYFTKFDDVAEKVGSFNGAFEKYQGLIDEIWSGKWDNMYDRWNKLAEAGYELSEVNWIQHLVNASEGIEDHRVALADLTDEQLREIYFTEEEIEAFRALQAECKDTGQEFKEVLARMEQYSEYGGSLREIFSNSFYKLGQGIRKIIESIAEAFREMFGGDIVTKLYDLGVKFAEFTDNIAKFQGYLEDGKGDVVYTEKFLKIVENITAVVKILLSIIKVVFAVIKGIAKIGLSIFKKLFGFLIDGLGSVDLTGFADAISTVADKISDWIDNSELLQVVLSTIGKVIGFITDAFKKFVKKLKESDKLTSVFSTISNVLTSLIGIITSVVSSIIDWVSENDILQKAIEFISGVLSTIFSTISNVVKSIRDWAVENGIASKALEILRSVLGFVVDKVSAFFNYIKENETIAKVFKGLGTIIGNVITAIINAVAAIKEWYQNSETAQKVVGAIKDAIKGIVETIPKAIEKIGEWFKGFADGSITVKDVFDQIKEWISGKLSITEDGGNFIQGFINGVKEKAEDIFSTIIEIAGKIISKFREILGINSPSTETYSDGENFVKGFFNGVSDNASSAWDKVKEFGQGIIDTFKNVDWGAVAAASTVIAGIAGSIALVIGITKKVKGVTNAIKTYSDRITTFLDGVGTFMKTGKLGGKKESNFASNMKAIALVIAALAAAMFLIVMAMEKIANMDDKGFQRAAITMGVIAGVIITILILTAALSSKFAELQGSLKALEKVIKSITKIATAFLIFAFAIRIIANVPEDQLYNAAKVFVVFGILIVGIMAAANYMNSGAMSKIDSLAKALVMISAMFLILAIAMRIIASLSGDEMTRAGITIAMFGGIIIGLMAFTKLMRKKELDSLSKFMLSVAAVFLVLAVSMKIIGTLDTKEVIQSSIAIGLLGGMIIGLMAFTKVMRKKDLSSLSEFMLTIAAVFLALAISMRIIGGMSTSEMAKALVAIGLLGGMIIGIMAFTKVLKANDLSGLALLLLGVSACLLTMAISMRIVGGMKPENMAKGLIAIAFLGGMIIGLLAATKLASTSDIAGLALIILAVGALMLTLALILVAFQFLDPAKLVLGTVCLTLLLGMLAVLVGVTSMVDKSSMASLIVLAVIIALIGGILIALVCINPEAAIVVTEALTKLMLSLSIALIACAVAGKLGAGAFIGVVALGALILVLAVVFAALGALVELCDSKFGEGKAASILDNAIMVMGKLGEGLGAFAAGIITAISDAIIAIIPKIGQALSDFMDNASGFIEGAKTIDGTVLEGIGILALAIAAIAAAEVIESILSFLNGGDVIEQFAEQLPVLGEGLQAFSDSISGISAAQVYVGAAAIKMLAEAAASIPAQGGILSGLFGTKDVGDFADKFGKLGTGLAAFHDSIKGITFTDNDTKAINYVGKIIKMAKEIPNEGGWIAKLLGDNKLDTFADQFPALGRGISAFHDSIHHLSFDENDDKALDLASKIITLAKDIPNEGGWIAKLLGDNKLDTFADQFPALGEGISKFHDHIHHLSLGDEDYAALDITQRIIELSKEIGNEGGWVAKIIGDNALGPFAEQFPSLGEGLSKFHDHVHHLSFDDDNAALDIFERIITLSKDIPNEGGWINKIIGDNQLGMFAEQFPALGEGIAGFARNVSYDAIDKTSMDNALTYISKLIDTFSSLKDIDSGAINAFVDADLISLAIKMQSVNNTIKGTQWDWTAIINLDTYIKDFKKLVDSAKGLNNNLDGFKALADLEFSDIASGLTEFNGQIYGQTWSTVGMDSLKEFITQLTDVAKVASGSDIDGLKNAVNIANALSDVTALDEFLKNFNDTSNASNEITGTVITLINSFVTAVKDNTSSITGQISAMCGAMKQVFEGYYSSFYSTGANLIAGAARGISENAWRMVTAARVAGDRTINALNQSVQVQSPSKLAYKTGRFIMIGAANGISDYASVAENAAFRAGDVVMDSFTSTVSRISSALDSNIDYNPTITPVLDLSNVTANANRLNSLLGMGSSIGISANAQIAAARMANRQNGNSDIISAINGLSDNLGTNGDVYNINGITYDDGSAVSNAVSQLVSAIQMERRM